MTEGCEAGVIENVFGTAGGVVLALCLFPQIYQNLKTKSTNDISYGWLGMYIFGLALTLVYLIMISALVGWIGLLVEMALALFTLYLKVYYENFYKGIKPADEETGDQVIPCANSPDKSEKAPTFAKGDIEGAVNNASKQAVSLSVIYRNEKVVSVGLPEDFYTSAKPVLETAKSLVSSCLGVDGKAPVLATTLFSVEDPKMQQGLALVHTYNGTCVTELSWDTQNVRISLTGKLCNDSILLDRLVAEFEKAFPEYRYSHSSTC